MLSCADRLVAVVRRPGFHEAVRVIAGGQALLAPTVTRRLIAGMLRRSLPMSTVDDKRLAQLTPRETEVLRLVARGLSNAEIAVDRYVTEHTVKTHMSSLLAKLGLRDRVQAVVFAYESGLVTPGRDLLDEN